MVEFDEEAYWLKIVSLFGANSEASYECLGVFHETTYICSNSTLEHILLSHGVPKMLTSITFSNFNFSFSFSNKKN
jgi:hypothetical protein